MAKTKIDKEFLIKNRFWILLGAVVVLVLASNGWLGADVSPEIQRKKADVAKQKRDLDSQKMLVATQKELENLSAKEQSLVARQKEVWQAAWDIQKDLIQWPPTLMTPDAAVALRTRYGNERDDLRKLYFGDWIPETLREHFALDATAYKTQVQDIVKLVEPTDFNGGWQKVVKHVADWNTGVLGAPDSEEMWLAEEDLVLQRELFKAVQETNQVVGRFKLETDPAKAPTPNPAKFEKARSLFRNPYWELDLTVGQNQAMKYVLRGTIKNVGGRRQMLGRAAFKVWVRQKGDPELINIQGESLAVDQSAPLAFMEGNQLKPEKELGGVIDPEGLFAVEQVLDLYYVPVKRIEHVAIGPGAHAHRTFAPTLLPPTIDSGTAGQPTPESPAPAPATLPAPTLVGARDAKKGDQQTKHSLDRYRYMNVTPQVRRLPIAFVVVLDPAYEQDLRTALSNSKLRLQMTQVDWHRFRGELKPSTTPRLLGPIVPISPQPTDPNAAAKAAAAEQPPMSLIEVAYYGIASLYERYPPRTAAAPEAVAAGSTAK